MLKFGFDACERSCHNGKIARLIYASDLAEKPKKHSVGNLQMLKMLRL